MSHFSFSKFSLSSDLDSLSVMCLSVDHFDFILLRVFYPAKLSFISEGKIKFFVNEQVLRDFITTGPALQELLKEALYIERNNQY